MKKKFENLITVKSIVTIALTVVFSVLALTNRLTSQDFMTIFTVVISFYFGTQYEKKSAAISAVPDLADTKGVPVAECPYKDENGASVCETKDEVAV